MIRAILAALAAGLALAGTAHAERMERLRGIVETRADETLVIRRHGGGTVTVWMNPKTRMLIATGSRVRDIKPESYISVVTEPDGTDTKVAKLTLYSPSERGFEAGSKPWDTAPGATLTAGWIAGLEGSDPRRIRLRTPDGEKSFTVARGTPATQIGPGEKALLVPGADVVVFARTDAKGLLNADIVAVGRQGVSPTL